jgi:hypothetical protein
MAILLPTLLWPFVFFTSIFFFDNPQNVGLTFLLFLAVNAYPFYLLVIAYFNAKLFVRNRILGSILPLTVFLSLIIFGTYSVVTIRQNIGRNQEEAAKRNAERKKQGFIGVNDDYKIIGNKVFRYDSLIEGADGETFEIVSWSWQRDKNYYYRFGKRIPTIDRETFEDLGYHYGKDKNYVYYDDEIIDGADARTFNHIEGSQDGKDEHNCYRWGKKVDCKILETEE